MPSRPVSAGAGRSRRDDRRPGRRGSGERSPATADPMAAGPASAGNGDGPPVGRPARHRPARRGSGRARTNVAGMSWQEFAGERQPTTPPGRRRPAAAARCAADTSRKRAPREAEADPPSPAGRDHRSSERQRDEPAMTDPSLAYLLRRVGLSRTGSARWCCTDAPTTRRRTIRSAACTSPRRWSINCSPPPDRRRGRIGRPGRRSRPRPDAAIADGASIRLRRLAADAGLTDLDVELLVISLVPDLDSRFERLYGYLNDDVTRRRATIGLALTLADVSSASSAARARLLPGAPLIDRELVQVDDADRPFLTRALRVPDRVAAHLLGDDAADPALVGPADRAGAVRGRAVRPAGAGAARRAAADLRAGGRHRDRPVRGGRRDAGDRAAGARRRSGQDRGRAGPEGRRRGARPGGAAARCRGGGRSGRGAVRARAPRRSGCWPTCRCRLRSSAPSPGIRAGPTACRWSSTPRR